MKNTNTIFGIKVCYLEQYILQKEGSTDMCMQNAKVSFKMHLYAAVSCSYS